MLLLAALAQGATLRVGTDWAYTRVSDAVLASSPGDVIEVDPGEIDGLHFECARIPESEGGNGAGVRMQGSALTVNNCVFTENQNGLLAGGT